MNKIIEERKVVQRLSIFVNSRTYQKLHCQVFDYQKRQLISKCTLSLTASFDLQLGRTLDTIKFIIRRNAHDIDELIEFAFRSNDQQNKYTIIHLQNCLKVKQNFAKFTLIFYIYFKMNEKDLKQQKQMKKMPSIMKQSQMDQKRKSIFQKYQIVKTNLKSIGNRIIYKAFNSKKKISLPQQYYQFKHGKQKESTNFNIQKKDKFSSNLNNYKMFASTFSGSKNEVLTNIRKSFDKVNQDEQQFDFHQPGLTPKLLSEQMNQQKQKLKLQRENIKKPKNKVFKRPTSQQFIKSMIANTLNKQNLSQAGQQLFSKDKDIKNNRKSYLENIYSMTINQLDKQKCLLRYVNGFCNQQFRKNSNLLKRNSHQPNIQNKV